MSIRNFTCISCPIGCSLKVFEDPESKELNVTGNKCPKGVIFAKEEFYAPRRVITTIVSIDDQDNVFLPVISDGTVPKDKVFDCIHLLQGIRVKKPIKIGEVVVNNILNTNIDICAAKTIK